MNLFFHISRAKTRFDCRNKLISSKEEYAAFMKKCADEYKPQALTVTDNTAKSEAKQSELFCVIPEHSNLGEKYGFPYSAGLSDKENSFAIMHCLTEHTNYCGATRNILPDDAVEILPNSFDLPYEKALNCRSKAISLTDILNSYGIKALPVCCVSIDGGSHFIVNVWLKEENRFIVLDPSFNCYFSNENGRELSIYELRECVLNNSPVTVNGYSFLGTEELKDYYFNAFIKDLMANISTWKTNKRSRKELSKVCGVVFDTRVPKTLAL